MYRVFNSTGCEVSAHKLFLDAWLEAIFFMAFSHIVGPEDIWLVNPPKAN
jgi:hypothetical protein